MISFGAEEITYFAIYFTAQLLINLVMCVMKHDGKVTQLKKEVAKDPTKQAELDEAIASADKALIHRNPLAEFTFFFMLRHSLMTMFMRVGRFAMTKLNARPPVFITFPAQIEEIFEMADELATQWNLNKKYFQREVYQKITNKMLVVVCQIPLNKIASAIPAAVFPPYKKFPGLVSAIKQVLKSRENMPLDVEHTDNSQDDKKHD